MAFDTKSFLKDTAKSAQQRITTEIVSRATSGMPINLISSASSIAEAMFNAGSSFQSISAFTSMRTDSIVSAGADIYFGLAGKDPARASAADVTKLRNIGVEDLNYLLNSIVPTTTIEGKRKRENEFVLDALI